ncbi:MAG: alpha-2-macroglobulin [Woeseiaceae bacterium]|nr:alpha-2-macroglobulin [Woeseiaceae bacterium]
MTKRILRLLIGDISWTPPAWLARIGVGRGLLVLAGLTALVVGGIATKRYFDSLPQPPRVVATAIAPGVSAIVDDEIRPQPLRIRFDVRSDPRIPVDTVESVARIDLIGQVIEDGVSMSPELPGTWRWSGEMELHFEPAEDWPAGQRYRVSYDPSVFAPGLEFERLDVSFETPAFMASLDELQFYQDPVDRNERRIVATLSFSHPVDDTSIVELLTISTRESGTTIRAAAIPMAREISFDATRRKAFVNSETIRIPDEENYATLTVGAGLAPQSGPSRLEDDVVDSVRIPDVDSYFRVGQVNAIITRDSDDAPQQSLVFEFTDQVQASALRAKLRAWVLPKSVRMNRRHFSNKRWRSPREVTDEVLAQASEYAFDLNPTERPATQFHSANIDVPEESDVYLRIDRGLESEGEFVMARMFDTVVRVPRYPREVSIAQSGAILPLTRDHKLTFLSRGVESLKVEIGRLIDSQVNHIATQTRGDIKSPWFTNYQLNEDNFTVRETRYIDLSAGHPRDAVYSSLDLSEFLPAGGYYFINVQGWDRGRDQPAGGSDRRFVLVTDLGLLVKANADSSQDVFVQSISSGAPVGGATVQLLGKNGVPVFERTTSVDGRANFPETKDLEREKTPAVFVVRAGRDSVFMPFNRGERKLQLSRFDIGGEYVYERVDADKLKAQVFSDRGIYRPGDTVNLASIVKSRDWQPLGELPLRIEVRDPRGQVALDEYLRLPPAGFFDQQLETDIAWPTGQYAATVYLVDRHRHRALGSTSFKVEEFQPDRLRIRTRISGSQPRGWIKPEGTTAEVTLQNLFGTPAQSRRVSGELRLTPSRIYFDDYSGYTFVDPLREPGSAVQPVTVPLAETRTDDEGRARLPLELDRYDRGIYQVAVMTEGFEEGGGRSVRALATAMMSPLDHLVGYKADTDLSFVDRNARHSVDFVALDRTATSVRLENLTATRVEERYVSTLVRRPNGTYAYQSLLQEHTVDSQPFEIAADGSGFTLPTGEPGSFAVKIVDASGLIVSKVRYTVAGARNLAGNLERNAELELNLDGSSFEAGDEIRMEITAPYTGAGLITIERDRVYAHKWFTADTTTSTQSIVVPEGIEGNAYISVAFVRDLDSPEIFVSPLSYAVEPFSINRAERTIDVDLEVADLVRPGTTLDVAYAASRPSRIVVYGVDEGILQVARYQLPRPLDFFLPKLALQVSTLQMVDLILPEFEAFLRHAAPGGGEGLALAGKNLNPFQRRTDKPVVFWSGVIDAGPDARTLAFDVPDYFNGEIRIMAIAVNEAAVGREQETTTVRGPFVVTPNLLTAAAPGDEFDVHVGISNNLERSGPDASIDFTATVSAHLEIVEGATQTLAIAEGSEGRASLRVRARQKLGGATMTFVAAANGESVSRNATVSVRPPTAYLATVDSGTSTDDPLRLALPRTLHGAFASQSVAASASPLVLTDGMLAYLEAFPHHCAEQTVSRVFPQLGFLGSPDPHIDRQKIRDQFSAVIAKLRTRQMPSGGFRFWSSSAEPHDFSSVYITHFLSDARQHDLPVPGDMLDAALGFLQQLAGRRTASLAEARLRAYAIYLLTRNGHVTTNSLTNLHEYLERAHTDTWRKDIASAWMAASYLLLKQEDLGERLIGGYVTGTGLAFSSDFDTRLGRDAVYVYLVARHFPDRLSQIGGDGIEKLIEPVLQNRFNTLSAAYTIMALDAWTEAMRDENLALSVHADDEQIASAGMLVRAALERRIRELEVRGSGGNDLFYVVTQTGFDLEPPAEALANGLEILREYLDADGNAVTTAGIGDELDVRLRIRSTNVRRSNVAVVDLLPGGFEVLTDTVQRSFRGWTADHIDVREDRVVIYGSFGDRMTEYRYKVKLTSSGSFIVPPAYANAMYDQSIEAHTRPARFDVAGMAR